MDEDEDEELVSDEDSEPEIEESEDSGSEFEIDEEQDKEDQEIMLDAAVRLSLQTASPNGAGSSSKRAAGPNPAAILRAAAAERRLAMTHRAANDAEFNSDDLDGIEIDEDGSSSDEEALSKGKGKATAKPTKKIVPMSTTSENSMTISEMRQSQRAARKAFLSARRANKKEERALITKLGRRLTHVCFLGTVTSSA